ncbi:MAG: MBG-2 domain-containing protein, partial [Flavobacteriia bacterium]|nr:MBG-2 domain-containing protein [Flavobacteriia bacterium]
TISNSYATGSVESKSKVGGLIGNNHIINVQITNSYFDIDSAAINGTPTVDSYGIYHHQFQDWLNGGLSLNPVTYFGAETATNSYKVSGIQELKDLLGFANKADYTFTLAANIDMADAPSGFYIPSWAGTFDGNNNILSNFTLNNTLIRYTGLFGQTTKGANIKNIGLSNINVSSSIGSSTGGLVGYNQGTINNSYVTGTVTSTSGSNVGGLVGSNSEGTINNSYVTGTITSTSGDNVGGLVGYNTRGAISNSYASGTVSGATRVGGLIGYDAGTKSISISNNYAANHVSGASKVGGLVGLKNGITLSIYTSNFWDVTRSGLADGLGIGMIKTSAGIIGTPQTGVTGLTTQQMHTQSSFVPTGKDAKQWNFTPETGVWVMVEGQSNPLLRALMTPLTVTANNATKTYDGQAYNGSAGVTYSVTPNMANLSGTLSYHSGINTGTHDITLSGLISNQSYLINYINGTLTVEKKPITASNEAPATSSGGSTSTSSGGSTSTSSGDVASRAIRALPNGEKLIPAYTSALITPQTSPNISNTNNINEGVTTNNFTLFNSGMNSSRINIDKISNEKDNDRVRKKDDSTSTNNSPKEI